MKIFKIVLTGGPCAGKTTAVEQIKKELKEKNIPCIVWNEVATELINSGIKPWEWEPFEFQSFVLEKCMLNEEISSHYKVKNEDKEGIVVILFDRAIYDNMAYLNESSEFFKLLRFHGLDPMKTLDSYDLVIDMLSLATCKPIDYNIINNLARTETPEEACEKDLKTSQAWANHRNLKIMSSVVSEAEEIEMIKKTIYDFIDGKYEDKVTRFLVDSENSDLSAYNNYIAIDTDSFYLDTCDDSKCKVSQNRCNGVSYTLEIYKDVDDRRIKTTSTIISEEYYNDLLYTYNSLGEEIAKEIGFVYERNLCKLIFDGNNVILEIHSNNVNDDIKIPNNINVIREINSNEMNFGTKFKKKVLNK